MDIRSVQSESQNHPRSTGVAGYPYGIKEMKYPAGGEPENYILRRTHSAEVSAEFGLLSALVFNPGIDFVYGQDYHVVASSWDGSDFFVARVDQPNHNYVSQRAKEWLEAHLGEWVAFEEKRVM